MGLNLFHIQLDVLHLMDLGFNFYLLASVIFLIVFDGGLAGPTGARILLVWEYIEAAYVQLDTCVGERVSWEQYIQIFDDRKSPKPTTPPVISCKVWHRV